MSGIRFTDEFNHDAVAQVVDRGHSVAKVSERLEISTKWLYTWRTQFSQLRKRIIETTEQAIEIRRLKKELARVSEGRDILKKATVHSIDHRNISANLQAGVLNPSVFLGRVFKRFATESRSS